MKTNAFIPRRHTHTGVTNPAEWAAHGRRTISGATPQKDDRMSIIEALRVIAPLSETRTDDEAIATLAEALGVPASAYTWNIATQSYESGGSR